MSATASDMARSAFSTTAFAQLIHRLRHSNARYNQIALQFRCRLRPTFHAKRRAYRAGLRIDILKARALAHSAISHKAPAVVDWSMATPSIAQHGADAYMRLPCEPARRRDGAQRILLRLPPLKLHLSDDDYHYPGGAFQGPVPGAPKLLPRQLPEDECGVEEMVLESATSSPSTSSSSFLDRPESLLTPVDSGTYSGLFITIPPRGVKRKLQEIELEGAIVPCQQPKRVLRTRWNNSQRP